MQCDVRVLTAALLTGGLCGALCFLASDRAVSRAHWLSQTELHGALAGACPNIGCETERCRTDMSCTVVALSYYLCVPLNTKCFKIATNNFARCGAPGSQNGFTCSETSGAGCVIQKSGDQNDQGQCSATSCTMDAGTCGTTSYTCTATACST